jgi:hypothetical protein
MPTSKNRKEHNKKVKNRNEKIKQDKLKINKLRREWISNLIKKEQEKGLFDNTKNIDENNDNNLELDGPVI